MSSIGKILKISQDVFKMKKALNEADIEIKDLFSSVPLRDYFNPFLDWLWGIAFSLALLKDICDYFLDPLVPFGMILASIFSVCATAIIFLIMYLTGARFFEKTFVKNLAVPLVIFIIEWFFPGLRFIPGLTINVFLLCYFVLLMRRMDDQKEVLKNLRNNPA